MSLLTHQIISLQLLKINQNITNHRITHKPKILYQVLENGQVIQNPNQTATKHVNHSK
jgi:hypothetical protein